MSPMFVHDQALSPAAHNEKAEREKFYKVELIDAGGRLVIGTAVPQARQAVWDFLKFQIREHKNGNPQFDY